MPRTHYVRTVRRIHDEAPSASIEWITPAMAKEYLAKNMGNRHIIPSAVTNFTHSMLTGEWDAPNGEPIIFCLLYTSDAADE